MPFVLNHNNGNPRQSGMQFPNQTADAKQNNTVVKVVFEIVLTQTT